MTRILMLAVLALSLGGCAPVFSTSGRVVLKDDNKMIDVSISDRDRAAIEDYYKGGRRGRKGRGLPPGLAKRGGDLPPGLARRDRLPPGLSGEPLPRELEARLAPLPSSYVRVRVGGDIVLMDRKTRVVVDVASGVEN